MIDRAALSKVKMTVEMILISVTTKVTRTARESNLGDGANRATLF